MESEEFISWGNGKHPVESAKNAYENGFYLEAIQVLQGWIECKLRELLILVGSTVFNQKISKIDNIANSVPLNAVIKVLYTLNQITQKEFQEVNKLNKLRNELVHKYFYSPDTYEYYGVRKREFDKVFNRMKKFAYEIDDRVMEICDINFELRVVKISRDFPFEFYKDANKFLKKEE